MKIVLYNNESIRTCKRLHSIRYIQSIVEREIAFFSSPKMTPRSINKKLDTEALTSFRKYIHDTVSSYTIKDFDMLPGELAYLCGHQWLSDMHLMWIAKQLNNMQFHTHVVFLNFLGDIETYCKKRVQDDKFNPIRL